MPTQNEPVTIYEHDWILRYRPPLSESSSKAILLLHGWTGDETVMWVFARNLPKDYWILAPRGPVKAPSGYGWNTVDQLSVQRYHEYEEMAAALIQEVGYWKRRFKIAAKSVDLMGFSQGAALSYALLVGHAEQIGKTAALAGFLPPGIEPEIFPQQMTGKEIFIAHGSKDETVPVRAARHAAEVFEKAGAKVIYCEDEVGHKLGASCNRGLAGFLGEG